MPRRFVRVDVTNALKELEKMGRAADQALEDMQIELAQMGRDKMVEYIETRGTGRRWGTDSRPEPMHAKEKPLIGSLRAGSFPGRVNTGRMRDAVRIKLDKGPRRVSSAFGWIDAPSDDEKYFRAQEYGMKLEQRQGFRKSINIPGMFALRDARLHVVSKMPTVAEKYKKRLERGKYS
jgi:hypothetical protein